jgi:predicted ester cyclase
VVADGDAGDGALHPARKQSGAFFGIPATRRPVTVAAHAVLKVRDGKVTELFGIFDEAGMLRQLGALPAS